MKVVTCLGAVIVAATAVTAAHQMERADAENFRYSSPETGEVALANICAVSPNKVSCWRPDRTVDRDTTAKVDATLSKDGQDLRMHYRKVEYLLIFKTGDRFGSQVEVDGEEGSRFPMYARLKPDVQDFMCVQIPVAPDKERTSVTVNVPISYPVVKHRPNRTDTFTLGSWTLTVEKVGKGEEVVDWQGKSQKQWEIRYELRPAKAPVPGIPYPPNDAPMLGDAQFIGRDGKPIKMPPAVFPPMGYVGNFSGKAFPFPTAWVLTVDPSKVDHVEIHASHPRPVRFADIPLRPATEG